MDKRQTLLAKATEIALRHPDLHPFSVAVHAANAVDEETDDFDAFLVGLLHDSIEDDYSEFKELILNDFSPDISGAVGILTKGDDEDYWAYINRVKVASEGGFLDGEEVRVSYAGLLARRVKLADALVNLNRCRSNFGYGNLAKRYERVIKELS